MNKKNIWIYLSLHLLIGIFSVSGIFSKYASQENSINIRFLLFYSGVIFLLFVYALWWQQIVKKMPLTIAYANKAVTVIWGMIWGTVIFGEKITIGKIVGAFVVVLGVITYVLAGKENEKEG